MEALFQQRALQRNREAKRDACELDSQAGTAHNVKVRELGECVLDLEEARELCVEGVNARAACFEQLSSVGVEYLTYLKLT